MYNILLVDDEDAIRRGIKKCILSCGNEYRIIGEADNGEKALELLTQVTPDIIITDINMAKMDGLELIESALSFNPKIKTILITGYDRFDFAHRAIELGVSDYLLKPIDREKLNEVLSKVCRQIDKDYEINTNLERMKEALEKIMPAVRERFLKRLISGKLNSAQIKESSGFTAINLDCNCFDVLLFHFEPSDIEAGLNEEYILGLVRNICIEKIKDDVTFYPFYYEDDMIAILTCSRHDSCDELFRYINSFALQMLLVIEKSFNIRAQISIGRPCKEIGDLYVCSQEAQKAMQHLRAIDKYGVVNYEDISLYSDIFIERPYDIERDIIANIRICNENAVLKGVELLTEFYFKGFKGNSMHVMSFLMEFIVVLKRTMEDSFDIFKTETIDDAYLYQKTLGITSIKEMKEFILRLAEEYMTKIRKAQQNKKVSIVKNAEALIKTYMTNPELTVDMLAGLLYVSPNYLRYLFKQETGKSFVEYITALRVDMALELLNDFSVKIQDIAEKVGYNDPKYFSYCFKKQMQVTPTEYREIIALDTKA